MGQALYRKYRSRNLSEIVGQEHITDTLKQALKQGRISHAYLLTGPRGVGKTSIARILAHEINGLPYEDDSSHIDIIEIDAASNRRIDEIRDLREKVYIAPAEAKYKVYIIDEVHMLTREAFNALLKTLEEPPAHVVFILATTDAHKLPETIVSRTQRFSFKPVSMQAVMAHLADIAKDEKITVSQEALELLAEHGEGSFRDSISMLDQASSQTGKLEVGDVQRLLGIPPDKAITALLQNIAGGADTAALMKDLTALYDQGYQPATIAKQLGQTIRRHLMQGQPLLPSQLSLELLSKLIAVPSSHDPARLLEIIILRFARPSAESNIEQPAPRPEADGTPEPRTTQTKASKSAKPNKASPAKATITLNDETWTEVLGALKRKHNTIYSIVRMAQPKFLDDNSMQLIFTFPFHQKRINESANHQMLVQTIRELTDKSIIVECILDETAPTPKIAPSKTETSEPAELTAISNIFGGGELLES